MVSMQTNLSVLSGLKDRSFQTPHTAVNKKNKVTASVTTAFFQFKSQITTATRQKLSDQNAIFHFNQLGKEEKAALFYGNTPISELSSDQATALIQDDGYFGIDKTSQRIIDFVIQGAGDDLERLQAGRQGVLKGFGDAETAWGGSLPGICCKTIEQTIKALDDRIAELGGNIMEITV